MALLILAATLQSALAPYVHFNQVHPNFVLVMVLAWSFVKDIKEVFFWAFWGGFILDMLSDMPFGVFTLSLIITAGLANFWQNKYSGRILLPVLLTLPYTFLFNLFVLIYIQWVGDAIDWRSVIIRIVFPEAMINIILMALVLPLLIWFNKFTQRGELSI